MEQQYLSFPEHLHLCLLRNGYKIQIHGRFIDVFSNDHIQNIFSILPKDDNITFYIAIMGENLRRIGYSTRQYVGVPSSVCHSVYIDQMTIYALDERFGTSALDLVVQAMMFLRPDRVCYSTSRSCNIVVQITNNMEDDIIREYVNNLHDGSNQLRIVNLSGNMCEIKVITNFKRTEYTSPHCIRTGFDGRLFAASIHWYMVDTRTIRIFYEVDYAKLLNLTCGRTDLGEHIVIRVSGDVITIECVEILGSNYVYGVDISLKKMLITKYGQDAVDLVLEMTRIYHIPPSRISISGKKNIYLEYHGIDKSVLYDKLRDIKNVKYYLVWMSSDSEGIIFDIREK